MMRLALDPMEVPAAQAWLEDWAARGWYVESYGRNLVSFARGERREHIRYRLQPRLDGGNLHGIQRQFSHVSSSSPISRCPSSTQRRMFSSSCRNSARPTSVIR